MLTTSILATPSLNMNLFILTKKSGKRQELDSLTPESRVKGLTHFATQSPQVGRTHEHGLARPVTLPCHSEYTVGSEASRGIESSVVAPGLGPASSGRKPIGRTEDQIRFVISFRIP